MKYLILIIFAVAVYGCEICQPVGSYEDCVEEKRSLCLDIEPKCEVKEK